MGSNSQFISGKMKRIEGLEASNKKQKGSEDDQEDRISNLPDSILLHILSFLPMKDVVKTVLLRRFGNLWTSVQSLDFDGRSYLNFSKARHSKWYRDFVTHVLHRHECSTIFRFSLKFGSYLYFSPRGFKPCEEKKTLKPNLASTIDSWIYFALRKKVKILNLGILAHGSSSTRFDYDLPAAVFISDSVTELNLVNISLKQPEQVNLKTLKSLSLTTIVLDDKMMETILSGCPSLESLSLNQCFGLEKLNCTSVCLTKLVIVIGDESAKVEISGPNLTSLTISGLSGHVDVRNIASVSDATLDFWYGYCAIGSLLEGLHQASTFTMSSWCIMMLLMENINIPCASSLRKHLVLKTIITKRHLVGITRLLRSSPHLETLTIHIGDGTSFENPDDNLRVGISGVHRMQFWNDERWMNSSDISMKHIFESDPPFTCLTNHMKTVCIYGACSSNSSLLQLVKFLLGNCFRLERMEIHMRQSYPYSHALDAELLELSKLLSTYPKASPTVVIALA